MEALVAKIVDLVYEYVALIDILAFSPAIHR